MSQSDLTCELWYIEDMSHRDQQRMRIFAGTNATKGADRLAIAKRIALESIEATGYDFTDVFLIPSEELMERAVLSSAVAAARVEYAPLPALIPLTKGNMWKASYREGALASSWPYYTTPIKKLTSDEVEQFDIAYMKTSCYSNN